MLIFFYLILIVKKILILHFILQYFPFLLTTLLILIDFRFNLVEFITENIALINKLWSFYVYDSVLDKFLVLIRW